MTSQTKLKVMGLAVVACLFLTFALWGEIFESVDADEILVVQAPTSGELTWYVQPGIKWQGFGKVTNYRKMSDTELDTKIQFNDKGTGIMKVRFQMELPLDTEHLTLLHTKYGSQEAIVEALVKPTIKKVIFMTGPTMTSEESVASKKTELIRFIIDQIENGVYRTTQRTVYLDDPLTKERRQVIVAEIVQDKTGKIERQELSALNELGIRVVNFAPSDIEYDKEVTEQFKRQQEITMKVQTAMAQTRESEQRKLTSEADGQANVMKAKYEKEVEKIQAVTVAEQGLLVATLDAKSAEQRKRENILLGEGEAERKRLVMNADGALQPKLDAWLEAQKYYANAIGIYTGNWVPEVVMGGTGTTSGGGAMQLMELLTAKTAKDLALDLSTQGKKMHKGVE